MEIISHVKTMQEKADSLRSEKKRIGFVPTMGALHQGHLSLIKAAKEENDVVIVSIFVNPIQFSPGEDYEIYPKPFEMDKELCGQMGVDIIFYPETAEMYPEQLLTTVHVSEITSGLCGQFRPGHFQGVTTVVAKLFSAVKPHVAYFGQKDYQQAIVIKKMVKDLNFDIRVKILPIVREGESGLALSSRNAYLNPEEREQACILFQTLQVAEKMLDDGERDGNKLANWMRENLKNAPLILLEYAEVCDPETLKPLSQIGTGALLALAVRIGKTRLIDNMIWDK
ncbi:pantoate--beta-alanine ligase [Candidatus Desantisbacteria bacterium]|nr:pantoate--beta-alanine ligase [Candidatus Desantisbacteria bacterium]